MLCTFSKNQEKKFGKQCRENWLLVRKSGEWKIHGTIHVLLHDDDVQIDSTTGGSLGFSIDGCKIPYQLFGTYRIRAYRTPAF